MLGIQAKGRDLSRPYVYDYYLLSLRGSGRHHRRHVRRRDLRGHRGTGTRPPRPRGAESYRDSATTIAPTIRAAAPALPNADCIHAIEVWLIVGVEIGAAFDHRRGRTLCGKRSRSFAHRRSSGGEGRSTHLRALLFQNRFARQPDAVAFDGQHLHQHLIAFFQFVANILDAMLGDFADVQQAFGPGNDFDECAEIRQPRDFAEVGLPYFGAWRSGRE